jgi:leucyl aminopeptidase
MNFGFAENIDDAIETYICTPETFENLMIELGDEVRNWCKLHFFSGNSAQALLCSQTNKRSIALLGCGSINSRKSGRFFLAAAAKKLPAGYYNIVNEIPLHNPKLEVLGWLMSQYKFTKFKSQSENSTCKTYKTSQFGHRMDRGCFSWRSFGPRPYKHAC